jgi:hypothetical protein
MEKVSERKIEGIQRKTQRKSERAQRGEKGNNEEKA